MTGACHARIGGNHAIRALLSIVGVVDTVLFLGMADQVFVGHTNGCVDRLCRVEG